MRMYSAKSCARLPLLIGRFATLSFGKVMLFTSSPACFASALIWAGVMSGEPTMFSWARVLCTVLWPL